MADKLQNGDDKKGFAGLSGLVSDVTKDIEQANRQATAPNNIDARPPHIQSESARKLKKPSAKFYASLIICALIVAWFGGGFNNKDHSTKVSSNEIPQDGKYKKAAISYYYSGNQLKRHSSINVDMERTSGRTDAEIIVPLAKQMNFDLVGARDGGYSDQEIIESLISNQILDNDTPNQMSFDERRAAEAPPVVIHNPLAFAPNGKPWPTRTGYLSGYAKLNTGGLSTLTIDNSSNDSNVYLKLFSLDDSPPFAVRHVFIKAGDKFTFRSVRAGNYDVRYRDLRYGGISKTDSFDLHEINESDGTRYSQMTMTLYKVQNGNMQMRNISESEF
jgi:hypothetical protein